jgi:endonuclease/exonuclease/phosphatase family metal-dependent hydrolase
MSARVARLEAMESRVLFSDNGTWDVPVMTQNLYMGGDLTPVMGVTSASEIPGAVSAVWDSMVATNFTARAKAVAKEIAVSRPVLIGLQEAEFWQSQGLDGTITYDFVQLLVSSLQQRGMSYAPVVVTQELAAMLPDDRGHAITLIDRDVILARTDLPSSLFSVSNPQSGNYATAYSVPIADTGMSLPITRGWGSVDATFAGSEFRFVNTHLDSSVPAAQFGQAVELVAGPADSSLPTIVVGDFNSDAYAGVYGGPDATPTYRYMLSAGFADGWAQTHHHELGLTWGQSADLRNVQSTATERIDFIFTRNGAEAEGTWLVGNTPGDRTQTQPRLWPSDHCGVVARVDVGAPILSQPATGAFASIFHSERQLVDSNELLG